MSQEDACKTPSARDPLAPVTNRPRSSFASNSSASSSRHAPTPVLRQMSIMDLFGVHADSIASSSRLSLNSDDTGALHPSSEPSVATSPCATSSTCYSSHRRQLFDDDDLEDGDDEMMGEEEAGGRLHSKHVASQEESRSLKRRKTLPLDDDRDITPVFSSHARWIASQYLAPMGQMSVFASVNRRMMGLKVGSRQISMLPFLQDFVSNNELEVFRCHSVHADRHFSPPFACAFSRSAKSGNLQLVAVASEEGVVSIFDAGRDNQYDLDKGRIKFQAHRNAIFDVAWSRDDRFIATASGDQCARITDVATQQCVGVLAGHSCTIKNIAWDLYNPNLLSTASRDGAIRVWDRRISAANFSDGTAGVATVNLIKNAHGVPKGAPKRSAMKSVTAVAYLPGNAHLLLSSGSSDGIIKMWDLRKTHSRRKNPPFVENNEEAAAETITGRAHGIASMAVSPNGQSIFALSTDSHIYSYDPNNLSSPTPVTVFRHPEARYGSFYVRLAISPCSRYLASGSSDGGVYMWDVQGGGSDGVRLVGHEREVGCLDWAKDRLATCSDDNLVRVWSPRPKEAREAREDKTLRWRWSGAEGLDTHTA